MRTPALPLLRSLATEGQLVHAERLPARPARTAELLAPTRPEVWEAFRLPSLWTHQAAAIDLVRQRQSVVVATGTASGKSLCYQIPIAEAVTGSPPGSALLLFPTKALAQDQLRVLSGLGLPGLVAATYDGDTGPEARAWTRRNANVLLTNPEMLHTAILPFHGRWATFLSRLRYVVVDELHVLRGVFGSHVAHLLRRLRRLCARYGGEPTFVFSSATIGEPARLASALSGVPVTPVTDDGSPRGERLVALWNPPLLDEDTGVRVGSNGETARVAAGLVEGGWTTVGFCRSRRGTEIVAGELRRRMPDRAHRVRSYRAGYLAAERREIEGELFSGLLDAVVATSALELGIDVGGLDAVVMNGFPGTIASMWQQVGRAGRGIDDSLAVLVAGTDQLDQWLMTHPVEVFTRPPEQAVVNPGNPSVLDPQLGCAAYEQPLVHGDDAFWGEQLEEGVRRLVLDDHLRLRDGRAYWHGRGSPAPSISLRSGGGDEYRIVDVDDRLVGTVDPGRAFEQVHPGAIYLHLGQ